MDGDEYLIHHQSLHTSYQKGDVWGVETEQTFIFLRFDGVGVSTLQ
jgi:hypothetical protein